MDEIEIYSSRKKSILILIGSIIFVVGGIFMFMSPEKFIGYRASNPTIIQGIGIVSALFFGMGIYISIKQLIENQLILVIDKIGINVNPKKSSSEKIEWKNIVGFFETTIHGTKIILIDVDNPDYWIENETNTIRRNLMKFNLNNYGSPFNLSANTMQINHNELIKILNENLNKYKFNT